MSWSMIGTVRGRHEAGAPSNGWRTEDLGGFDETRLLLILPLLVASVLDELVRDEDSESTPRNGGAEQWVWKRRFGGF